MSPRPALIIHPEAADEPYRRYLMNRFPFGLIYRYNSDEDTVTIFAVAHLKRRPGYWTDRPV